MAYSQKERWALRNAELLNEVNSNNKEEWIRIGKLAFQFATNIYLDADKIRPDDIAPLLAEGLEGSPAFKAELRRRRKSAKFYYSHFANLIIDEFWETIISETGGNTDATEESST